MFEKSVNLNLEIKMKHVLWAILVIVAVILVYFAITTTRDLGWWTYQIDPVNLLTSAIMIWLLFSIDRKLGKQKSAESMENKEEFRKPHISKAVEIEIVK